MLLFCFILFGNLLLNKNNKNSCFNLENEIEKITKDLPARQLLWLELSEKKYVEDSYDEFQLKYNNKENQEFLYNLLVNNKYFTASLEEFRLKYFRKDLAREDLYQICIEENILVNKDEFDSLLIKQGTIDRLYKKFVAYGYKHSIMDFKNLVFGTEDKQLPISELRIKFQSITELKQKLEKKRLSIFSHSFNEDEIIGIALILFSVLFIFRYLVYGIKWSLRQIKDQ